MNEGVHTRMTPTMKEVQKANDATIELEAQDKFSIAMAQQQADQYDSTVKAI